MGLFERRKGQDVVGEAQKIVTNRFNQKRPLVEKEISTILQKEDFPPETNPSKKKENRGWCSCSGAVGIGGIVFIATILFYISQDRVEEGPQRDPLMDKAYRDTTLTIRARDDIRTPDVVYTPHPDYITSTPTRSPKK